MNSSLEDLFIWLYSYRTEDYIAASYLLTLNQLRTAASLKIEMTNNELYDKFIIVAKAMGNTIKSPTGKGSSKRSSELPKADFNTISAFLGAM